MTLEEIKRAVEEIRQLRCDDERAHNLEDTLHQNVLRAIVDGPPNAPELARAALETLDIAFARWCA